MRLLSLLLSVLALASFAKAGRNDVPDPDTCWEPNNKTALCDRRTHGIMVWPPAKAMIPFSRRYNMTVTGVDKDKIYPICERMRWSLKRFGLMCMVWYNGPQPYCGPAKDSNTTLEVFFETSMLCEPWKVHKAWWVSTANKFGDMWCCKRDRLAQGG